MKKLFLSTLLLLAACSSGSGTHPSYIIYSPNAEPLNGGILGHPSCEKALGNWFDRADANHDGIINAGEFAEDASAQFTRMDIDKNGFLVSEELQRYRAPYRQENERKSRRHKKESKEEQKERLDSSELIDPVMSADSNLDFKVTREEFLAQSQKNFSELDADHNGTLSRTEVLAICHKEGN